MVVSCRRCKFIQYFGIGAAIISGQMCSLAFYASSLLPNSQPRRKLIAYKLKE